MGAIRRTDLADAASRALDDVRQTKAAADFDQLAARYWHRFTEAERVQYQQQRGGVVVDHGRRFRTSQCAQHRFDRRVAFTATTLTKVVFERHWIDGCFNTSLRHRATDLGTAEVRVDDRAGHVEHVSKPGPNAIVEAPFD